jgi:hypothetical protein
MRSSNEMPGRTSARALEAIGRVGAFSGEVGTGSPEKKRSLKDNPSEFRFN